MSCCRPILLASALAAIALSAASCSQPASRESDLSPHEAPYGLNLVITGDGRGEIRIVPPDVICRSDCSQTFNSPVSVTLTVTVEEGSAIGSWGGACSSAGTTRQCLLRVEDAVTAHLQLTGEPQPDDENDSSGPDENEDGSEEDGISDDDERDEEKRGKKGKGENDTDPRGDKDEDQDAGGKNEDKGDNDRNNGENNDDSEKDAESDEGGADEEGRELLPRKPVDVDLTFEERHNFENSS